MELLIKTTKAAMQTTLLGSLYWVISVICSRCANCEHGADNSMWKRDSRKVSMLVGVRVSGNEGGRVPIRSHEIAVNSTLTLYSILYIYISSQSLPQPGHHGDVVWFFLYFTVELYEVWEG